MAHVCMQHWAELMVLSSFIGIFLSFSGAGAAGAPFALPTYDNAWYFLVHGAISKTLLVYNMIYGYGTLIWTGTGPNHTIGIAIKQFQTEAEAEDLPSIQL